VPTDDFPTSCYNHLAHNIREHVSAPVLVAGRILSPEDAEKALAEGACDVVGMTRALIADPLLPRRVRTGAVDRIRPCIAINEGCRRVVGGNTLSCTVNPEVGDSAFIEPFKHVTPRRVVVVGGGPAGMEAARVAAERGHEVILLERDGGMGGQIVLAARSSSRPHLGRHVTWLASELARLGVETRLGTAANREVVASLHPDALVVSTGSTSYLPDQARDLSCSTATDVDVIDGSVRVEAGSRVVVYDAEGYHRGGSVSVLAVEAGAHVELVTPFSVAAENLEPPNKRGMYRQLDAHQVRTSPSRRLIGGRGKNLLTQDVWTDSREEVADADLVIFVGYQRADTRLYDELLAESADVEVHLVGDARAPRLLRNAISEGAHAGLAV